MYNLVKIISSPNPCLQKLLLYHHWTYFLKMPRDVLQSRYRLWGTDIPSSSLHDSVLPCRTAGIPNRIVVLFTMTKTTKYAVTTSNHRNTHLNIHIYFPSSNCRRTQNLSWGGGGADSEAVCNLCLVLEPFFENHANIFESTICVFKISLWGWGLQPPPFPLHRWLRQWFKKYH